MKLKVLSALIIVVCISGIYWAYRNGKKIDEIQAEGMNNIVNESLELEEKVKYLKEREDALLQENGRLIVQVNELKMEVERLSRKPEQPKPIKKNEKTVPISNSASKRITEFLSKRYENE